MKKKKKTLEDLLKLNKITVLELSNLASIYGGVGGNPTLQDPGGGGGTTETNPTEVSGVSNSKTVLPTRA